jgi:hypothetical protein
MMPDDDVGAALTGQRFSDWHRSPNVEDRRDDVYTLRQQWDDQNSTISKHINDLLTHPLSYPPREPVYQGDPSSPIAKEAGVDSIRLGGEKPQNNVIDYLLQDLGGTVKTIKDFSRAAYNEYNKPKEELKTYNQPLEKIK